jgi:phosphoglycolate phosphatase-like HAD superfamily hydrolase
MNLELRKAFVFDIDGTLIDSNSAQTLSWQNAFELILKKHYPYAKIRRLIGMSDDRLIAMLTGIQGNSPVGQSVSRKHSEILLKKHLPNLKSLPKARELLQALKAKGIRTAAATNLKRGEMENLLRQAGLLGSFDFAISSQDALEDTEKNPILAALHKFQLAPKDAYFVADTPYDIEYAKSVGVDTLALRSGGWDDDGLARAFRIYDELADIALELQSPVEQKVA